mgnify:CR=1 FL=1
MKIISRFINQFLPYFILAMLTFSILGYFKGESERFLIYHFSITILAFQAYILIQITKYVKVYLSIKQSEYDMKAKLLNEHLELLKSAHKVPEAEKDTNTPEETH